MEMFNVHRRDILDFDNYMDLKKPGFGGPSSAVQFKDKNGKRVVTDPKLKDFQRVVERDPTFASRHYDSTYKAMTHDVIYKQEKKKPVDYRDPYLTALPVVDMSKIEEGLSYTSFEKFITETEDPTLELKDDPTLDFEEESMKPEHSEEIEDGEDPDEIERLLKSFE